MYCLVVLLSPFHLLLRNSFFNLGTFARHFNSFLYKGIDTMVQGKAGNRHYSVEKLIQELAIISDI